MTKESDGGFLMMLDSLPTSVWIHLSWEFRKKGG